jgi:endonuclease/exonuclease/phosphatase family metal-dependent hydrolase
VPGRLRIATLNLLYYPQGDRWAERRPLVEAELAAIAPDVIAFQEVNRLIGQDHALAAAVPGRRYVVVRASETVRPAYPRHWDGVVSLVSSAAGEILDHEVRRLSYLRVVQAIRLRGPGGRTVRWLNTHLHHPDGTPGYVARLNQVRAILGWLTALPPAAVEVLAGDLNASPDEPAIAELRRAGFISAYEARHGHHEPTYPSGLVAPSIPLEPPLCIDYLWVRGSARVIDARLAWNRPSPADASLFPSDHRGLVADLELRE